MEKIKTFQLQDFAGKKWTIFYEGAFIPPVVLLERGEKIKLMGEVKGKEQFIATEIRPWGGMRRMKN